MRRRTLPRWLGAVACAAVPLAGCRSAGPTTPPAPVPASAAPAAAPTGPLAALPATVKVTASGSAPKQPLRAAWKAGQTERATWDVSVRLALAVGQMRPPELRPPTVRLTVRSEVSEIDEAGAAIVDTRVEKVEVIPSPDTDPQLAAALTTELQALTDVRIAAEVSPLTRVERLSFRRADEAPPQVKTTLEAVRQALQLVPTLPPEAVGRGATWHVDSHPRTPLLALDQTIEYRLPDAIGADRTVRVVGLLRQSAVPQPVALPNLPPGAKVTLKTYAGNGELRAERAEGDIYGALEGKLTTRLSAAVEGRDEPERELRMATTYDVRLSPRR